MSQTIKFARARSVRMVGQTIRFGHTKTGSYHF